MAFVAALWEGAVAQDYPVIVLSGQAGIWEMGVNKFKNIILILIAAVVVTVLKYPGLSFVGFALTITGLVLVTVFSFAEFN